MQSGLQNNKSDKERHRNFGASLIFINPLFHRKLLLTHRPDYYQMILV